jgi:adenylylsulfate kinase-like enzyme
MIIWLFGQPCSGKTTLAHNIQNWTKIDLTPIHLIDGDEFREVFTNKDYGRTGREKNIERASIVAKYMESCGQVVICSFVTPYKSMRDTIKEVCGGVKFIYLKYDGMRGREGYHVADFEEPNDTEALCLDTSQLSKTECVKHILNYINE